MAQYHLLNTGSATAPEDTWAKAFTTLSSAAAGMAAGDILFASSAHAESGAGSTLVFPGTVASPNQIIGGTPGATSGLTATATGAAVTVTGTSNWSIQGSFFMEDVRFIFSQTSSIANYIGNASGNVQRYKGCDFSMQSSAASSQIVFGSSTTSVSNKISLENCRFRFGAAAQTVAITRAVEILGGSIESGGTTPTSMFSLTGADRPSSLQVDGFDFSNFGTGFNVIAAAADGPQNAILRNCKFPSGWTGGLIASGIAKPGFRSEMHNYIVGSTNVRFWIEDYAGSIREETTIKVTANSYAYKAALSANVKYPASSLVVAEAYFNVATAGSAKTVTWDLCTDNVTLTDKDAWLEVEYLGTASSNLATITSGKADALTVINSGATNLTTSGTTWTTTGLTTPVQQSVSRTFTPQAAGHFIARLRLAKASTTIYCDQAPVVS